MQENMLTITTLTKSATFLVGLLASIPIGKMLAETVTINEDTNIPLGVACGVGLAAITATASFMSIKFGQKNTDKRVSRLEENVARMEEKIDSLPCRVGDCDHTHKRH